jgi:hypothetical protein
MREAGVDDVAEVISIHWNNIRTALEQRECARRRAAARG